MELGTRPISPGDAAVDLFFVQNPAAETEEAAVYGIAEELGPGFSSGAGVRQQKTGCRQDRPTGAASGDLFRRWWRRRRRGVSMAGNSATGSCCKHDEILTQCVRKFGRRRGHAESWSVRCKSPPFAQLRRMGHPQALSVLSPLVEASRGRESEVGGLGGPVYGLVRRIGVGVAEVVSEGLFDRREERSRRATYP